MHGRPYLSAVRALWVFAALGCFQVMASAGVPMKGTSGLTSSGTGTTRTFSVFTNGGAVGGDLILVPPAGTGTITTPGGWGVARPTSGNLPTFTTSTSIPTPGMQGGTLPITATTTPTSAATMASTMAKFATMAAFIPGTVGTVGGLFAAGFGMWDLLHELTMAMQPDPNNPLGPNLVTKEQHQLVCQDSSCFYTTADGTSFHQSTPDASCNAWASSLGGTGSLSGPDMYGAYSCRALASNGASIASAGTFKHGTPVDQTTLIPQSEQDIADAIAAQSGWPTSSHIAEALKQAITAPLKDGTTLSLDVKTPTVTGPASVTGQPTTTHTDNPDGSKVDSTNTPKSNLTYSGPTVTNNITNSNVTNNTSASNVTTTTTTTTTNPKPDAPEDPKDPCEENPDRAGCAKLGDTPTADELTKDSKAMPTITPVQFAGGGCPAPIPFSAFGRSYSFSYATFCEKLALVAPLLLAMATLGAAYIVADGFKVS